MADFDLVSLVDQAGRTTQASVAVLEGTASPRLIAAAYDARRVHAPGRFIDKVPEA